MALLSIPSKGIVVGVVHDRVQLYEGPDNQEVLMWQIWRMGSVQYVSIFAVILIVRVRA